MGKQPLTVYLMTRTEKKIKEIVEETGMLRSALLRLKRRFKE